MRAGFDAPDQDERRRLPRYRLAMRVDLVAAGQPRQRCWARDLSVGGVLVEGAQLWLPAGTQVTLIFPIAVGGLIRLRRRQAVVVYQSRQGTGLRMLRPG